MIRTFQAKIQIAIVADPDKSPEAEAGCIRNWLEKLSGIRVSVQSIEPIELVADFPDDEMPTRREGIKK
jgi:hypothetical protein